MSSTLELIGQLGTRCDALKKKLEETTGADQLSIQEELDKVEEELSEALKKRIVECDTNTQMWQDALNKPFPDEVNKIFNEYLKDLVEDGNEVKEDL